MILAVFFFGVKYFTRWLTKLSFWLSLHIWSRFNGDYCVERSFEG